VLKHTPKPVRQFKNPKILYDMKQNAVLRDIYAAYPYFISQTNRDSQAARHIWAQQILMYRI
jgi:hypothetical protein